MDCPWFKHGVTTVMLGGWFKRITHIIIRAGVRGENRRTMDAAALKQDSTLTTARGITPSNHARVVAGARFKQPAPVMMAVK
jgi:hypothetical protein